MNTAETIAAWSLGTNVITLFVVCLTAGLYWLQIRGMHLTSLVQFLESPPIREARKLVMDKADDIREKPFENNNSWDNGVLAAAAAVCASYNYAGHLAKKRMVPRTIVFSHWGISARRLAAVLKTYIDKRSETEGSDYLAGFRWLAENAPT